MGLHILYSRSLFLLIATTTVVSAEFKWVDDKANSAFNCAGKVADAVCCKDNFCEAAKSETDCSSGNKQFLCGWKNGKCSSFRDDFNNVCCQSEVKDACDKVVRGICPADWQVPDKCCSDLARKWEGTLVGVKPGFVCCNAPCAEMQKAGCPLPNSCAPSQRSLGSPSNGPPAARIGFTILPQQPRQFGNVLQNTGFGGDYGLAVLNAMGDGKSKNNQVDEITVDDLMTMLIDSLSADKDAMVYNSEMNSDPWMGKIKSGGSLANLNLPDPNRFIDQIYGNPFGMSNGNLGPYPSLPPYFAQSMLGYPVPQTYPLFPGQSQYPYSPAPQYQTQIPYSLPQYPVQPYTQAPAYPQPPQYQPQPPPQQYQPQPPPQFYQPQPQQYQQPPPQQYQQPPPQQYQQPPPQQYQQTPPQQYQQTPPQQYQQPPPQPQYQPAPAQPQPAPAPAPIFPTEKRI